ncbi:MarR family winged helix-turn-helix transcriptional regulator [Streptomyces roseolus]|uniref:MarR family winged helix-turn-helix transcriptional regulator n=1 Tax=Streptomyces roseolus TaxID=67358 RepID=UPI0036E496D5
MTAAPLTDRWMATVRAGAQIVQAAERLLSDTYGLCVSAFEIMDVMEREGDWLRAGELSARVSRSQPQVSRLLAQMVDAGYAERRPCATDRRGFDVRLTSAGRRIFAEATATVEELLGELSGTAPEVRGLLARPGGSGGPDVPEGRGGRSPDGPHGGGPGAAK